MGHFQVSSHRRYLNPLTGWLAGAKRTRHGTRIRRIPPTVLCLLSGDTNEIKGFPCCQDKSFPPSIHPRSRQRAMFAFRMHVLPTRILIGDDSGIPPVSRFMGSWTAFRTESEQVIVFMRSGYRKAGWRAAPSRTHHGDAGPEPPTGTEANGETRKPYPANPPTIPCLLSGDTVGISGKMPAMKAYAHCFHRRKDCG